MIVGCVTRHIALPSQQEAPRCQVMQRTDEVEVACSPDRAMHAHQTGVDGYLREKRWLS